MKLTEKQRRFADYYIQTGNASEAYRRAGHKGKSASTVTTNANRLLTNADIMLYIAEQNAKLADERIADMKEIKQFWTDVLRGNEAALMKDRLKASELIAKTNGAFLDRVEHSGNIETNPSDDVKEILDRIRKND